MEGFGINYVLMTRVRVLVIVHAPEAYAPSRVREAGAVCPVLGFEGGERRPASETIEWPRNKRDEPRAGPTQATDKQQRKR